MLKIRLQRSGRRNRPNYRIVVAEHSSAVQGSYIDLVGTFDPLVEKHGLKVNVEKVDQWIQKGAKPSNTIARLLKGQGHNGMDKYIVEMKNKMTKNPKEQPAAPTPAPAAPETTAVAEETAPAPEAPAPVQDAPAPKEEPTSETPAS